MGLKQRNVLILGAGIAGLSAACALAEAGANVTIIERAAQLGELGAGLQISPNGHVVLRALGLESALIANAIRAQAVELRDGYSDQVVTRLNVGQMRPDQGWYFIHRADLIAILADCAHKAGVKIKFGQAVARVTTDTDCPQVWLEDGSCYQSEILIGADGLHSKLRAALCPQSQAFFTGQTAWRMVIDAQGDNAPVAEVHMGAKCHLVSYPLRGGQLRNIVAVQERSIWTEEGWAITGQKSDVQAAFANFSPRVQGWLERVSDIHLWGLHRHPIAPLWAKDFGAGCAYLVGDAAHPTLPFLAQGANMALEDIWCLRNLLLAEAPIAQYQAARAQRVEKIVTTSTHNARNYHLSGPKRWAGHQILRLGGKVAPRFALSRFNWLYDYDVTKSAPTA